jgi:hypothetical protein
VHRSPDPRNGWQWRSRSRSVAGLSAERVLSWALVASSTTERGSGTAITRKGPDLPARDFTRRARRVRHGWLPAPDTRRTRSVAEISLREPSSHLGMRMERSGVPPHRTRPGRTFPACSGGCPRLRVKPNSQKVQIPRLRSEWPHRARLGCRRRATKKVRFADRCPLAAVRSPLSARRCPLAAGLTARLQENGVRVN